MISNYNNIELKLKMYILSLWLLFCFIAIATIDLDVIRQSICNGSLEWIKMFTTNVIPAICFIMVILCGVFYFQFKYKLEGTTQLPTEITKISNKNADYLAFLSTYIVPLVFIDFSSRRQIVILLLLLISIGVMYVKTDMFLSNPTLALLGYRIYEVETDGDNVSGIIISQGEIEKGDKIRYIRLDKNAFFVRKV